MINYLSVELLTLWQEKTSMYYRPFNMYKAWFILSSLRFNLAKATSQATYQRLHQADVRYRRCRLTLTVFALSGTLLNPSIASHEAHCLRQCRNDPAKITSAACKTLSFQSPDIQSMPQSLNEFSLRPYALDDHA